MASIADDRLHLRVRRDLGNNKAQAVGFLALSVHVRPASIQAAMTAISSAVGPRLVLGRHDRFGGAGQDANDAASLGVAGQKRGAVRGPSLQRGETLQRELPLAILVVVAARAIFLEKRSDACRVIWRGAVVRNGRPTMKHNAIGEPEPFQSWK